MKVVVYCPISKNLEMFKFSSEMAIRNAGIKFDFVPVIDTTTSIEVMEYIREKHWNFLIVKKERSESWIENLYNCWNRGYDAFNELGADVIVPMGSDHAFYYDWLKNLAKYADNNRIVNCKLIENGALPSVHECYNFGYPGKDFRIEDFYNYCKKIYRDELITSDRNYGRRMDAMPFALTRKVWEKFGPMIPINEFGVTGDTAFFNKCKENGVEICKSLSSISFHVGAMETRKGA